MTNRRKVFGFTSTSVGLVNAIKSSVLVAEAFDPESMGERPNAAEFEATWDTGATNCVISERVVEACGLKAVGMTTVGTPTGTSEAEVYLVNLQLPNDVGIAEVRVTKGQMPNVDVLIGMDIITLGDFVISNFQGQTTFSFRIPSCQKIDLEELRPSGA